MTLWTDLRQGLRLIAKNPGFTGAAVAVLSLGIAANMVVFTLVNGVLLRDWNRTTRVFEGIAGADEWTMNLSDDTRPAERFRGAFVSANAFGLIGQRPILGRDFRFEDDREGAAPVVILGHAVWQRRYVGDPSIVGRVGDPRILAGVAGGVMMVAMAACVIPARRATRVDPVQAPRAD